VDKIEKINEILPYLSPPIRRLIKKYNDESRKNINGIRMTADSPLIVEINRERVYIGEGGGNLRISDSYFVSSEDIRIVTELITKSSMYSYSRYINECFLTLPGGNRAGIVGECVIENGRISSVKNIYSIYIRVSSERKNCSKLIFEDIYSNEMIYNTLIISPPGCGKTTLLRDLCFQFSSNKYSKIVIGAIIDERFEIACTSQGIPNADIGKNNFVISGCPKKTAIPLIVRSMSPDVIFMDELDAENDFEAVRYAFFSGCKIIATTHGNDIFTNRVSLNKENIFEKYIVLSKRNGPGTVEKIYKEVQI